MQPPYVRPGPAIPASWPQGDAYLRQTEATLPAVTYRDIFQDARLQTLIEQALTNNRDLMVAAANIAAAREQVRIQRAQQLPQIDATARASADSGGDGESVSTRYELGVGINAFEIDLFGRLRSLTDVQRSRYFATEAAARATRLALVADIATAWLTYAADQKTALAQDVNLLRLLVGAEIDAALLPGSIDQAAPTVRELPAGLDSLVLLRRPDVVEAEYQLRAANAQIGAARAALFPRITLTGLLGLASTSLAGLFSGGAFQWSPGSDVTYTIFQGGAGRANVRLTEAQREAAVATYQRTIQQAFREVSDALARRGTIGDQLRARQSQRQAAADTYLLTEARYRNGIDSFLGSLDAQRSYYSAQRTLVLSRLEAATNLVDLYRSLGGDSLLSTPDQP